jgi:hypothetical protein
MTVDVTAARVAGMGTFPVRASRRLRIDAKSVQRR